MTDNPITLIKDSNNYANFTGNNNFADYKSAKLKEYIEANYNILDNYIKKGIAFISLANSKDIDEIIKFLNTVDNNEYKNLITIDNARGVCYAFAAELLLKAQILLELIKTKDTFGLSFINSDGELELTLSSNSITENSTISELDNAIKKYIENTLRKVEPNTLIKLNGSYNDGTHYSITIQRGHNHYVLEKKLPIEYNIINRYIQTTMLDKLYYKKNRLPDISEYLGISDFTIFKNFDEEIKGIINDNLKSINSGIIMNSNYFVDARYSWIDRQNLLKAYSFSNYIVANYMYQKVYGTNDLLKKNILSDNEKNLIKLISSDKDYLEFVEFIKMYLSTDCLFEFNEHILKNINEVYKEIKESNIHNLEGLSKNIKLKGFDNYLVKVLSTEDNDFLDNIKKIDPYIISHEKYVNLLSEIIKIYNEYDSIDMIQNKIDEKKIKDLKEFHDDLVNKKIGIASSYRCWLINNGYNFLSKKVEY